MSNLAGIDYSMACPAITVYDVKTKEHFYHFYYGIKKHVGNKGHNILGVMAPEYNSPEERFNNLGNWAISVLKHHKVSTVGIESISYGSPGKIVELGENLGVLKHKMFLNNIEFIQISPQSVKKVARDAIPENERRDPATNNLIKMDKETVVKHFWKKTGIPLWDVFQLKPDKNPLQDIADSYFILEYLKQTL